ncbi:hypothetical protein [uncultured Arthrobacter sp.]|uniref:hypothetical protein n=1 Tax=uncultured Arthrobacter sp. TaxID=114050 RepID=UPI00260C85D0|nr:hypothetical protein [uncultured Arthrobacter sp.]
MDIRSARRRPATPHTPSSVLPTLLSLIGLTPVIIGILAMHVWMGGHGATAHPGTGSASTSTAAHAVAGNTAAGTDSIDEAPAHPVDVTLAALTASGGHGDQTVLVGCGTDCSGEMTLGMCVLALVLVGIAWLLTPTGRVLASSLPPRGPPLMHWTSRAVPAPSLTQLCISRT